ncbi:hypothetical protein BJ875DRAFT_449460 [Amylocarpus encephaloides]|uniref:Rhodanese domain-containing protein n=1 Tax=Amylocarpus encephaloides TaxID=45428 RepID=A0A9P7YSI3_9HELO|nr:hypothetical protein BJ875DRAFT_449460 [Amylocarpus encephaloides]
MSLPVTISDLPRVSATELSEVLLAQSSSNLDFTPPDEKKDGVAVVDVRDDDHIGGHIRSSLHVPSSTHSHALPSLVHRLRSKPVVVFHCALSQQRGPKAALQYIRERQRLVGTESVELAKGSGFVQNAMKKDKAEEIERSENTATVKKNVQRGEYGWEDVPREEGLPVVDGEGEMAEDGPQKVFILEQGFVGWQEQFGEDVRLTEGYRKELWKDGYWM